MKIVYMSIAGYTIQLNFHATEYIQTQAIFSDVFSKLYKGYLIRKWTKPVHMTIDFVHSGFTETKKEQNETHTRFYTVLGPKRIQTYYSISISQFALLLHYVLFDLLTDGFYLHASSSLYKGKVFIFLGPSGSGKSTAIQLLKKYATPFSDDSLIVRKVHNRYLCFQPPFIDKISIQKKKMDIPLEEYIL